MVQQAVTTWPPLPEGAMAPLVANRRQSIITWLRTANMYSERGAGGASSLLEYSTTHTVTHHALRANGVPIAYI